MSPNTTPDLIVQHPALADAALAVIAAELGRPADERSPTLARWRNVTLGKDAASALARAHLVDAALVPGEQLLGNFRLIAFDMDSTLITIECVDEIADFAGCKPQVAAITAAAMRGEIADYDESLRQRVALLEGLDESVLERVWNERLAITPGAQELLAAARHAGLKSLLVSGGFTFFTDRVKAQLGLDFTRANTLEVVAGKIAGKVAGEIVNAQGKRRALEQTCARIGCSPAQAIVVGDGANDLEMMAIAGISVAFHAKPQVAAQATYAIGHCGLDAIVGLFAPER
jgi:phosphoserine phosphatase